jgi:hypothetical protein
MLTVDDVMKNILASELMTHRQRASEKTGWRRGSIKSKLTLRY